MTTTRQTDPVLILADRCKSLLQAIEQAPDYHQVHSPIADRLFDQRERVVQQMIETPARSTAGVLAKWDEMLPNDLAANTNLDDLYIWTIQHVIAELRRLAARA
jgi:hypothetical protein